MFISALPIRTQNWKQPKWTPIDKIVKYTMLCTAHELSLRNYKEQTTDKHNNMEEFPVIYALWEKLIPNFYTA